MDAFVTRKRKSIGPGLSREGGPTADLTTPIHRSGSCGLGPDIEKSSTQLASHTGHDAADEESTDIKLALLASLHPAAHHGALLDVLLTVNGSVHEASQVLKVSSAVARTKKAAVVTSQTSLRAFAATQPPASLGETCPSRKKPRLLSRRGVTLHLYDPQDISEQTPCSVIHDFLPPALADGLLDEMLGEAKTFEKVTFKLFENTVSSPHTSALYVGTHDEMRHQKYDYVYNGAKLTVSAGLPRARTQVRSWCETGRDG